MRSGTFLILLLCLWGWTLSGSGEGVSLLQGVRFGDHGDFVRIVFDLRGYTTYRIAEREDPLIITVLFPQIQELPEKTFYRFSHPLLREVYFLLTPYGIKGEIQGRWPLRVKRHFPLADPFRIVVDITAQSN
ncbi:MAG: hypothetical protein D6736_07830 [Nitrospinota bacterium]|nr:MAG: hypothetical protein D6736_07830 [Nitrospinota bacterium]